MVDSFSFVFNILFSKLFTSLFAVRFFVLKYEYNLWICLLFSFFSRSTVPLSVYFSLPPSFLLGNMGKQRFAIVTSSCDWQFYAKSLCVYCAHPRYSWPFVFCLLCIWYWTTTIINIITFLYRSVTKYKNAFFVFAFYDRRSLCVCVFVAPNLFHIILFAFM